MNFHPARLFPLNNSGFTEGPVVYWIQRDQRAIDNWALFYAQQQALKHHQPLLVVFCLSPGFLGATMRQYGFMIRGLAGLERKLARFNIPFYLLQGNVCNLLPGFLQDVEAGMLVTDFNPLRISLKWKEELNSKIEIPFVEVDAHNIIPCRKISDKQEYAAFTLRKKVERLLPEFLTDFPSLVKHPDYSASKKDLPADWTEVLKSVKADHQVREVDWLVPGEAAASEALVDFVQNRLDQYGTERNFPDRKGQSELSPYLHFGHLSAQRVALEVQRAEANPESKMAFLEELIVRRELADNFCLYNAYYDNFRGFQPWARDSLDKHREDPREFLYSPEQFEQAITHDPLWNAAQMEMVETGKMHGFMRMYWAKKILEWTNSPEDAMETAIYLNDKYSLDGRDPNGYAGIAWSIGGVHDRPWGERSIFGMVRYMNYAGCKRKFDIKVYIKRSNGKMVKW